MQNPAKQRDFDFLTDSGAAVLEAHVRCYLGSRIRDFQLVVTANGLILRGSSQTYHVKQLAQQVVMKTTAFPIRANEIEVA